MAPTVSAVTLTQETLCVLAGEFQNMDLCGPALIDSVHKLPPVRIGRL